MFKKGFSMIELLFVMVILAALTAIAIPNMSGGERAAAITSAFSDTRNIINLVQSKYIEKQDYAAILDLDNTSGEALPNGFAAFTLKDGTKIPLSPKSYLYLHLHDYNGCKGFTTYVLHEGLNPAEAVIYDSCENTVPYLGGIG